MCTLKAPLHHVYALTISPLKWSYVPDYDQERMYMFGRPFELKSWVADVFQSYDNIHKQKGVTALLANN